MKITKSLSISHCNDIYVFPMHFFFLSGYTFMQHGHLIRMLTTYNLYFSPSSFCFREGNLQNSNLTHKDTPPTTGEPHDGWRWSQGQPGPDGGAIAQPASPPLTLKTMAHSIMAIFEIIHKSVSRLNTCQWMLVITCHSYCNYSQHLFYFIIPIFIRNLYNCKLIGYHFNHRCGWWRDTAAQPKRWCTRSKHATKHYLLYIGRQWTRASQNCPLQNASCSREVVRQALSLAQLHHGLC